MKYLKYFKESKEDIHSLCKKYDIRNYTINEDGSIDVDGNVYLNGKKLIELPLKFGKVSGDFSCHFNNLTSLEGSPREVGGHFSCGYNQLITLEGSPLSVGGIFNCYGNKLTSLSGISKYISGGGIYCPYNKLRDVRGVKDGWRGYIDIDNNPVHEIFKLFPEERCDEVIEYLNEHDVIRDGKVVVLQALELVFHEMGLEVPEIDEIEGYEIQY